MKTDLSVSELNCRVHTHFTVRRLHGSCCPFVDAAQVIWERGSHGASSAEKHGTAKLPYTPGQPSPEYIAQAKAEYAPFTNSVKASGDKAGATGRSSLKRL